MKNETREYLHNFLKCNYYGDYNFLDLYKIFAELERVEIGGFKNSILEFYKFLTESFAMMKFKGQFSIEDFNKDCYNFKAQLLNDLYRIDVEAQKSFIGFVSDIISKDDSLLDVGGGAFPVSTILYAERQREVHGIDKYNLSIKHLKELNVLAEDGFFIKSTDISKYDIIVGRRPCEAIENMVRQCVKYNKPYIIQTCDCKLPVIEFYNGSTSTNNHGENGIKITIPWQVFLKEIDPDVKFINDIAYNIGDQSGSVDSLYEKYNLSKYRGVNNFAYNKNRIRKFLFGQSEKD